jgi:hypothetical protein
MIKHIHGVTGAPREIKASVGGRGRRREDGGDDYNFFLRSVLYNYGRVSKQKSPAHMNEGRADFTGRLSMDHRFDRMVNIF